MYENFFKLNDRPFNVNPDPRYLFMTPNTFEAMACLTYGIEARKGFVLLSGEVGTGKTTLLNKLLEWLREQDVATAFVFNPRLTVTQFFDFMMTDFGIPCDPHMKSQVLIKLNQWLIERYRTGQLTVLIVDEAQNLSSQMLEEIRLLTNLETSREKLLQIVLAGQSELEVKMNRPELRQLRQRITLRAKTRPLTLDETRGYIMERLRIAGGRAEEIFTPEAVELVHFYAKGIPRMINLISEHAMINAFAEQLKPIPPEIIRDVARDFELRDTNPSFVADESGLLSHEPPSTNGNSAALNVAKALNAIMERLDRVEDIARDKEERKP
jgi:general secretion pathway protein A